MSKSKKITMWFGNIPEIFGYGICVLAETEQEAWSMLKKSYHAWNKYAHSIKTFKEVCEYYGASVYQIETGRSYYDNFGM